MVITFFIKKYNKKTIRYKLGFIFHWKPDLNMSSTKTAKVQCSSGRLSHSFMSTISLQNLRHQVVTVERAEYIISVSISCPKRS